MRRADVTNITQRKKHGRKPLFWVLTAVGAIVAIVVLAIVVDAAVYNHKIHAGVSIAGQAVGGSTRDEATAKLAEVVDKVQANSITLTNATKTWDLKPADVGTKFDTEAAISAAMAASRDGNFFTDLGHRLKLYFSGVDVPLKGSIDSAMMDKYLTNLATQLDVAPVDASLTFEGGEVKVIGGTSGTAVDKDKLRQNLESLLLTRHSTDVPIPMKELQPTLTAADMQAAVDHGRALLSAPVTLTFKDKSWPLTTSQIGGFMDFTTKDVNGVSTMEPYLSAAKMTSFFASIEDDVATDPVDATFKADGEKAWVVPAVPGTKLDPETTAKALTAAALKTTDRTTEVAVTASEPKLTTAAAESMGIKDLLASYTTEPHQGSSNRQVNVRITTQYASDKFLAPGQEYDFDKTIGPRIAARGYKLAPGIVGGGEMEDVLGGGICQVSTTLFNAVFEAGLQVLERNNHSLYISHYPNGRDATVAGGGGKNFRFKNDTDHYIWIRGTSDGITTTFRIYGTDDGRTVKASFSGFSYGAGRTTVTVQNPSLSPGATHVKISGQSGRSCSVRRTITYADGTTHVDIFSSYYPMIPETIEVGPSTTTTTVGPTTTTVPGTTSTVVTEF